MKQFQHNESREHIREHLEAALFLAQASASPLLRYLIEMAIAENEGPIQSEPQSSQRPKPLKGSRALSVLVNADIDPGEFPALKIF